MLTVIAQVQSTNHKRTKEAPKDRIIRWLILALLPKPPKVREKHIPGFGLGFACDGFDQWDGVRPCPESFGHSRQRSADCSRRPLIRQYQHSIKTGLELPKLRSMGWLVWHTDSNNLYSLSQSLGERAIKRLTEFESLFGLHHQPPTVVSEGAYIVDGPGRLTTNAHQAVARGPRWEPVLGQ
ncbi:hypothetical protein GCM10029978_073870 [Actinoallomurus acanthiterrae]